MEFITCMLCGNQILASDIICEECINIQYSDNLYDDLELQDIA